MSKITFDTDVLIWYFRGNIKAKEFLEDFSFEDRVMLAPVYFELIQ
jgi:predicted nucleic acid-binding protein